VKTACVTTATVTNASCCSLQKPSLPVASPITLNWFLMSRANYTRIVCHGPLY